MIAGTLEIQMLANMARLQADMDTAKRSVVGAMASIEKSVGMAKAALAGLASGLLAGFSLVGLIDLTRRAIDAADAMNDLSQRVGISVKDLAKYELAASQSGTTMEALAKGIKGLGANLLEHGAALQKAGITAKDADGALKQVASVFASMPDSIEKTTLAVKLFGKSGMDLIPMLNMGAQGLEEAEQKAAKYAEQMAVMAPIADAFNDNMAELSMHSKTASMSLINDLLPGLVLISKAMAEAAKNGSLLDAAVAGIQTLLSGDDLHKANVKTVEGLDLVMAAESALAKARAAGDADRIARLENTVRLRKEEMAVHDNYRKMLQAEREGPAAAPEKPAVDPMANYKAMMKALGGDGEADKAAKEMQKLIAAGKDLAASLLQQDAGLSGDFIKKWESLGLAYEKGAISLDVLTKAQAVLLEGQPAIKAMAEAEIKAAQDVANARSAARAKEEEGISAYMLAQEQARHAGEQGAQDALKAAQDLYDQYGKSKSQIEKLVIAELKLKQARVTADSEEYASLQRQIELRGKLVTVLENTEALDQQKGIWQSIEQTAHSTFVNIFNGGQDAFTKLRDTLKATLLDLLYQMTVKKWIFNIAANVSGENVAGAAISGMSGGSGGMGNLGSLSSLYSMGSKAVGTVGGWFGIGGGAAATTPAVGSAFTGAASNSAFAAANGSAGAAGFAGIPVVGWIAMGMMASGDAYDQGFRSGNVGGEGYAVSDGGQLGPNGMLQGLDKILQGLGIDGKTAAILTGSALGSKAMYSVLGGYKVSSDGSALTGTVGGSGSSLQQRNDYTQDHRGFLGMGSYTTHNSEYVAADPGAVKYVDAATGVITASVKHFASTLGLIPEAVDGYTQQIDVSLAGLSADKQKEAIDEALTGFMDSMITSAYGAQGAAFARAGETASETMVRLATDLTFVNSGLTLLGYSAMTASLANADAASGFVAAAGGTDALTASVAYYYEHFRSDSQRAADGVAGLSQSFAALGIDTVPATRAQFDALLGGLDLTTTAGQNTAAGLLALAPAFDSVANSALAAANKMLGALADYGTSEEVRDFTVGMIQRGLADGGVNLTRDQIANASRADARALYEEYVAAGDQRGADAILDQYKAFANITQPKAEAPTPGVLQGNGLAASGSGGSSSGGGGSDAFSSMLSAWQSATDAIIKTMADLRTALIENGPNSFAKIQTEYAIQLAQARAGDLGAMQDMPGIAKSMVEAGKTHSRTALDQARLTARVYNDLDGLTAAAAARAVAASAASAAGPTGGSTSFPQSSYGMMYEDKTLAWLHSQNTSGEYASSFAGYDNKLGYWAPTGTQANGSLLADGSGSVYTDPVTGALRAHKTGDSDPNMMVPAFAGGGWHAGGWAMVGENGPELAHMPPAQIYTAANTRAMLVGGGDSSDNGELLAEIRLMRTELAESKKELEKITKASKESAFTLGKFDVRGMPPERAAA